MAVLSLGATIRAMPPTTLPCPPGGLFSVVVEIEIATDASGGSIDIYLYDDDLVPPDNLLDSKMNLPVQPNFSGQIQHVFQLKCDDKCNVAGSKGSSNEHEAEIYSEVKAVVEQLTRETQTVILHCDVPGWLRNQEQSTNQERL